MPIKRIEPIKYNKYIFDNPEKVLNMVDEDIVVIKDKLFTPTDDFLRDKGVESINEQFKAIVYDALESIDIMDKYRDS